MFRLFSTYYPERNEVRRAEYLECLQRNLANPWIDEVCLVVEGEVDVLPDSPKLRLKNIQKRPLYDDFFAWIREIAGPDDISAIANTDIYLGTNVPAAFPLLNKNCCLALARWEPDGLNDRNDSQDCWVFKGKVIGIQGDFPLGVVRCDNRILHELHTGGYQVLNPSFSIFVHHLHRGERQDYGDTEKHFVQPPYRYLWPHNLFGPAGTIWHNLRNPGQKVGWRVDRLKLARTFPVRALRKFAGLVRG